MDYALFDIGIRIACCFQNLGFPFSEEESQLISSLFMPRNNERIAYFSIIE